MNVKRLNHAVLWVRDARASAAFYGDALGFQVVEADPSGRAVFMRAGGSDNHHDLGLFSVGERPSPAPGTPGLYHLAWQVDTIEDLAAAAAALQERGSLVGATDHGVSKSLYAKDPDGIEFEVMWQVPTDQWGAYADHAGARAARPPGRAGPLGRRPHRLITRRRPVGPPAPEPHSADLMRMSHQIRTVRPGCQRPRTACRQSASVGWAWTKPSPWSTRGAPAGPRTAARRPARRRAAGAGRTPARAGSSGGAARHRACRRARRWSPASGAVRLTGPAHVARQQVDDRRRPRRRG